MTEPAPQSPRRRRRRLAFGLRGLMLLVLVAGLPMGWKARRASLQRRAVAAIQKMGGSVIYDWEGPWRAYRWNLKPPAARPPPAPWAPAWARRLVGDEYFQDVVGARFYVLASAAPPAADYPPEGDRSAENFKLDQLACLGGLDRLESLSLLDVGPLGAEGRARLAGLDRLKSLFIDYIDPETANAIGRLPALEDLTITGITVPANPTEEPPGPIEPAIFDRFRRIRSLRLYRPVDDAGLARIARMDRLTSLDAFAPGATDSGLAKLAALKSLESLGLYSAIEITDDGLASLAGMPRLTALDLRDTPLTGAGFRYVVGMPKFFSLAVSKARIDSNRVTDLKAARPDITVGLH